MSPDASPSTWRCATCDAEHRGLATVFGPAAPDAWMWASDKERAAGEINPGMCVIQLDGETHYFIRGELRIPVLAAEIETFTWSIWVSLSDQSMQTTIEHWADPGRAALPPMFGWLCNLLSPYEQPTSPLPTHVHTRDPGVVPLIELDPDVDHPLVREQIEGISLHRVAELNRLLLGE